MRFQRPGLIAGVMEEEIKFLTRKRFLCYTKKFVFFLNAMNLGSVLRFLVNPISCVV